MTKERRIAKIFTLPLTLTEALEARATETGEKMSRLVERGIRLVLELPPPSEVDDEESDLTATRSERVILEILKAKPVIGPNGAGWHSVHDLAAEAGLSSAGAIKALKALERSGEAFCWGSGYAVPVKGVNYENEADRKIMAGPAETRWALRDPREIVRALITRWDARADKVWPADMLKKIRSMLIGASEEVVKDCGGIMKGPLGVDVSLPECLFYERTPADAVMFRRDERQRWLASPEYAAEQAAKKAAAEKEIDDRRAAQAAHEAEQKRLDAEARAERLSRAGDHCLGCGGDKRVCGH